jgi:hypothetical protein
MTALLSTLAVAFAAFCVWLTVRIVNRRERWAKRTAVSLVVVLVGYPLSFGPAMWTMGWLLKAGQINEGGQVPFLLFYYPLACAAAVLA